MSPSDSEKHQLDEIGFLVLEGFMPPGLLARLIDRVEELFLEEGGLAGAEFKPEPGCRRLANLVDKGDVFRDMLPLPLPFVRHVLGPQVKLSSFNARRVPPNAGAQPLHADMSALPDEAGPWVCNTVWLLDDFSADNGTLRIVPGSHRFGRLPKAALNDPAADHPDQVLVTGRAGSVVVINAHAWHSGTANRAGRPRTACHAFYCRRDKPQQQHQTRLLRAAVQQSLSEELRHLLALDDPHNDRLSEEAAVRSGFLR